MLERYEYKYLVSERLAAEICATALSVGVRDPYAGPRGRYLIRSLYLDTDRQHLYLANSREAPDRFKARVRTYPQSATSPVFLEIKRRTKDVIRKTRAMIPPSLDWRAAMKGDREIFNKLGTYQRNAASSFARNVLQYGLSPRLLVEYEREAFASTIDNYARITIDRAIVSQARTTYDLAATPHAWRPIDHPALTNTREPIAVL